MESPNLTRDREILKKYTDQDLHDELGWRRQDRINQEVERRRERGKFLTGIIDHLAMVVPEHSRTSCSDDNPCNIGRCTRCTILDSAMSGYWDCDYDIEIILMKRDPLDTIT